MGSGRRAGLGRTASVLCVMAAFLAFGVALIMELVAYTRREAANPFLNGVTGLFALAALGAGCYAQIVQFHHWSRRVRHRLQVGLTVTLLTLLLVVVNVYDKVTPPAGDAPAEPVAATTADAPAAQEDTSLVKPGWYGELQQDGVMAVLASFADNASESRQFSRRVTKPVSYATLSVINLGSPVPVVLRFLEVGLLLDTGEEVQSLAVKPLLHAAGGNESLARRLTAPQTLGTGAMLPDIPVCLAPGFRWERVRGVKLNLNARDVVIPGRMMTADEKRLLLEKTTASKPSSVSSNVSAEAWFKDL
ncbi:MAG TPA: hypothetical protein PKM57_07710 [Kiritimatiellia bacterium]|nr:hypothetical protein [Kiritimatiellia bacterium]HPS07895.1 hypothetical protein [Kiritimatiellia bacterium]